jgi:hypothetical protein
MGLIAKLEDFNKSLKQLNENLKNKTNDLQNKPTENQTKDLIQELITLKENGINQ